MQKIIPFLWFENGAEEAVNFYVSLFKNSEIVERAYYDEASAAASGMPAGSLLTVGYKLMGMEFGALNGGAVFKFSPAVSFFVNLKSLDELDALWEKLSDGAKVMMPYDKYPFSEKYGWLEDKYGVSWQLGLSQEDEGITPSLLFVGKQYGRAVEAINYYTELFENSKIELTVPYEAGEDEGTSPDAVKFASFVLQGENFIAMDSGMKHEFEFTGAISLMVNCETQQEVDMLWDKLSDGGQVQQCGWLTDKFGVTWQIVPTVLNK